jgi:EAL domain-containing protein (putative c-di-GMP-specific phosphodiesterase class I)
LMKNADQAMYVAKSKGRNRFSHFTASLQQAKHPPMQFINELKGALAARQLRAYFQPIVDLSTGRINKAEALLRWQHPTHGMVSPQEFISFAENTGLINQIGDWIFKESARFAKRWSEQFADDFQVSVNVSPIQFKAENNDFATEWLHHLQEIGLPGKNMAVDIGEGMLLHATSDIVDKLHVFRDAGIQVAIDDFGTDYSPLSQYQRFDIAYLKIDQSYILDFSADPNDVALSEAIVMAHKLGYQVIAEGVETVAQHDLLTAARCDYAQGNLYSKPILPEELEALLKHGFNAQTQPEGSTMKKASELSLLTEHEAAAFLQPHMPDKSVTAWLAHDRKHDPMIPFLLVGGQPYFLESDLENFVTRTLNTSARFVRINNRLYRERRNSLDRRRHADQTPLAGGAYQFGTKRRRRDDLGLRLHPNREPSPDVSLDRRARPNLLAH